MFRRIRRYLKLQRMIQHEVLETLCTICLYLERDGHFCKNYYAQYMGGHFKRLKEFSEILREEIGAGGVEDGSK